MLLKNVDKESKNAHLVEKRYFIGLTIYAVMKCLIVYLIFQITVFL